MKFSLSFLVIAAMAIIATFAPWLTRNDPTQIFEGQALIPPWSHGSHGEMFWLGTDDLGRDLFSRIIFGARITMGLGLTVVIVSLLTGGVLGLCAGYFGGRIDASVTRLVDVLMSLPSLLLAVVVIAIIGQGLWTSVWAVVVITLPGYIRVARAAAINEKSKEYVTATRSFGAGPTHVLFRAILPNCVAPLIVQSTLGFSDGVLNMAALGFLGLGAQPPTPEWGVMLGDARPYIESSWWLVTLPGLCLLIVVLGFNLLGDQLRDALDPKLKR